MAAAWSLAREGRRRKAQTEPDADVVRDGVRVPGQALMEVEVRRHLGAERHERPGRRTGRRHGARDRPWNTRVGSIAFTVPRVRDGRGAPSLRDPRNRGARALVTVVPEHGRPIGSHHPRERRTEGVGLVPTTAAVVHLVGSVRAEPHDEWQVRRRCVRAESLATLVAPVPARESALLAAGSSSRALHHPAADFHT